MKRKKKDDVPEIVVPQGYDVFDLIDTNDGGYEFGAPTLKEEVKIRFERENTTE